MTEHKNTGTRGRNAKAAKMRERRKKQRRRRLIIIGVEVVLMLILAGCCYAVSMMGLLQRHKQTRQMCTNLLMKLLQMKKDR